MLTVDGFGVKYTGKEHAAHPFSVLDKYYKMEDNWKGKLYCGIHLKWNHGEKYVDISVPNYVRKRTGRI